MKSLLFITTIAIAAYVAIASAQKAAHGFEKTLEKRNQAIASQLASLE